MTFIAFDFSQIPKGATVRHATLKLHPREYSGEAMFLRANAGWDESNITWNKRPGSLLEPWDIGFSPTVSMPPPDDAEWEIDVSYFVTQWITHGAMNEGFSIESYDGLIEVDSNKSSSAADRPQLVIQYTLN